VQLQTIKHTDVDVILLHPKDYHALYDKKKIKFPKVGCNECYAIV